MLVTQNVSSFAHPAIQLDFEHITVVRAPFKSTWRNLPLRSELTSSKATETLRLKTTEAPLPQ